MTNSPIETKPTNTAALRRKQRKYIRKLAAVRAALQEALDLETPADAKWVPNVGDQVDVAFNNEWRPARVMERTFVSAQFTMYKVHVFGACDVWLRNDAVAEAGTRAVRKPYGFEIGQRVDILRRNGTHLHDIVLTDVRSLVVEAAPNGVKCIFELDQVYPLGCFKHGRC
jgi:hypothetical protein